MSAQQRTALVLAGGGSFGVVQVGMLRALCAHGVRPDLVAGSSVGAINGAFYDHTRPARHSCRRVPESKRRDPGTPRVATARAGLNRRLDSAHSQGVAAMRSYQ